MIASFGTALLLPMFDTPSEFEDETNRWFDYDHVPERLSCPGILSCERFVLQDIEPFGWNPAYRWTKYVNFYDLESTEVLTSPAYRAQRDMYKGRGSAWRQECEARTATAGRPSPSRVIRSAWNEMPGMVESRTSGVSQPNPRTLLLTFWDAADENPRVDIAAWLDEQYMSELACLPGIRSCQRYERDFHATGERADDARFSARFLDVVELSSPEVATSPPYRQWTGSLDGEGRVLSAHRRIIAMGVYLQRPSPWIASI